MTSSTSRQDSRWNFCGDRVPKQEVVFICQLIATFCIVIVALVNLSIGHPNRELWATLVGACFGYLVLSPNIRRTRRQNESIHGHATVEQFDELQSPQHGVGIHDQT